MRLRSCGRIARPMATRRAGGNGEPRPLWPSVSAREPLPPAGTPTGARQRSSLGPSGREFGRRHAGGHGRGARGSASWLADKGKGGDAPARALLRRAGFPGGSKGGGATLARARMFYIAWAGLATLAWLKPAPQRSDSGLRFSEKPNGGVADLERPEHPPLAGCGAPFGSGPLFCSLVRIGRVDRYRPGKPHARFHGPPGSGWPRYGHPLPATSQD